jgi:hypothetical protein
MKPRSSNILLLTIYLATQIVLIASSCKTTDDIVEVTNISLQPSSATIFVGSTKQLTATIEPSNATVKDYTWTIDNESVATVNSSGLVTGIAIGTVTVTATTSDGSKTATCVIAVSPDVFVAGYEHNGSSAHIAKYWKNGVATNLTDGTQNAYASSIFVSGSDIHVAGRELNSGIYMARYWKNGKSVTLTNGASEAYSVFVSNNDVYIAGSEYGNGVTVAKYWKNGVAVNLSGYAFDG